MVQSCLGEPEHALPPFAGDGAVQVLDCVPAVAPSLLEAVQPQAPQSDQPPSTRQPLVVQSCVGEPEHALPPFAGDGAVQVLDCVPAVAPSLLEAVQPQAPQSDQPPSTRQPLVVQSCVGEPEHALPPFAGDGAVQVLDCVPAVAPSLLEAVQPQAPQSDQPPSTRQPLVVQSCVGEPEHALPPFAGDGAVQVLDCVPAVAPSLLEAVQPQAPQSDQPPSTRQPLVVQSCVGEPEHALPPFAGDGAVQVLDCVPAVAPSLLEAVQPQAPQSDQPPSTRQPLVVQSCVGEPEHALPPFAGDGAVQVLDCVPAVVPSLLEAVQPQAPQSDQPPSTRQPLVMQSPEPSDQVPAVSLSSLSAVHTQVRCRLQVPLVLVQLPLLALQE